MNTTDAIILIQQLRTALHEGRAAYYTPTPDVNRVLVEVQLALSKAELDLKAIREFNEAFGFEGAAR